MGGGGVKKYGREGREQERGCLRLPTLSLKPEIGPRLTSKLGRKTAI